MSERMHNYEGRCHCGAIGFTFRTAVDPEAWPVRACQCGFCSRHGARTTADPAGSIAFHVHDPSALVRYRFGMRSADFLLCGHCGTYLGAVLAGDHGTFATLNVNAVPAGKAAPAGMAVSYEGESPGQRRDLRQRCWTPVAGGIRRAAARLEPVRSDLDSRIPQR